MPSKRLIDTSRTTLLAAVAVARHAGVELDISDWEEHGLSLPLLVDCAPSGKHLCEAFHRAGGVPAVMASP